MYRFAKICKLNRYVKQKRCQTGTPFGKILQFLQLISSREVRS